MTEKDHIRLKSFNKDGDLITQENIPQILQDRSQGAGKRHRRNQPPGVPGPRMAHGPAVQGDERGQRRMVAFGLDQEPDSPSEWTGGADSARDLFESNPKLAEYFVEAPGDSTGN